MISYGLNSSCMILFDKFLSFTVRLVPIDAYLPKAKTILGAEIMLPGKSFANKYNSVFLSKLFFQDCSCVLLLRCSGEGGR